MLRRIEVDFIEVYEGCSHENESNLIGTFVYKKLRNENKLKSCSQWIKELIRIWIYFYEMKEGSSYEF